jgi:hypothetical protein
LWQDEIEIVPKGSRFIGNYPIVDFHRSLDEAQSVTGAWLNTRVAATISILKNTLTLLCWYVRAGVKYVKFNPVFT